MLKYLFGAFFAFFAVVGLCAVAVLQAGINFRNASTNCAWITIYGRASNIGPWSIVSGDRPRNVKPGEYFPFRFTARNQIKVRAEVYRLVQSPARGRFRAELWKRRRYGRRAEKQRERL